jgi:hypothetical protein
LDTAVADLPPGNAKPTRSLHPSQVVDTAGSLSMSLLLIWLLVPVAHSAAGTAT